MSKRKLCVIAGDGIGAEVTAVAVQLLQIVTDDIEIVTADAGWQTFCNCGNSVPDETLTKIRQCGAALFGAVSSPAKKVQGYRSAILKIRQELDLYANLRPVKSSWNPSKIQHTVDLVIVRENSEGLYSGRESVVDDGAIAEKVVTRKASLRIGHWAKKVALERANQVLIAHKANVLPLSDGLFRDCVRESLLDDKSGPPVSVTEGLADIVAYQLVASPAKFDVIVTTNMFGDILSDLAAHWCGGMGRAPSVNIGDQLAVAEPVHGSAPDIAGQNLADPAATILAMSVLANHHWNDQRLANQLESIVIEATREMQTEPSFSTARFLELSCQVAARLKDETTVQ